MTSMMGAITDDYSDYVTYCVTNDVSPMKIDQGNFYETSEWKGVESIPHFRGCLGMALEKMRKD
ncbi:hypothetical protein HN903_00040 [archaeon]|jgi:hypothetical protein|nr:hypothetical protein [archaeon]MBT7128126.1 hypothetical protein [archaeon]